MENNASLAAKLLATSDDELYLQLGRELYGKQAFPVPPKQAVEVGRQWMATISQELTSAICTNPKVQTLGKQDLATHEQIILVCAIADIVMEHIHYVAAVTVSALLVRQGLHHLCAPHWKGSEVVVGETILIAPQEMPKDDA